MRPEIFRSCLGLVLALSAASARESDVPAAFRTDSSTSEPIRKLEAGQAQIPAPKPDSASRLDSATVRLTRRRPAIAIWAAVEFSDLDAKDIFKADFARRMADDSLESLQPFEEAHLSFPAGLQADFPLGPWFDAVAKVRFSWYKQVAILGRKDHSSAGEAWYAVQSSLGGAGLRFYVPPSLLSVTGSLGVYAQFLWMWNLGRSELYTQYGSASARVDPAGSGYELQFGLQKAFEGSWQVAASLGFVNQEYVSDTPWSHLLRSAPPAGKVAWGSSSVQAMLALWYHFGPPPADSRAAKTAPPGPAAPVSPVR